MLNYSKLKLSLLILLGMISLTIIFKLVSFYTLEKVLERKLFKVFGKAQKYQVLIRETSYLDFLKGKINYLELSGEKINFKEGLIIEKAWLYLENVKFDFNKIKNIQTAIFKIILNEEDLNTYFEVKNLDFRPSVDFKKGEIEVILKKPIWKINIPLKIIGNLEVKNYLQIWFIPKKLNVAGLDIPSPFKEIILNYINPLIDLKNFIFPIEIIKFKVAEDKLIIQGKAKLDIPFYFKMDSLNNPNLKIKEGFKVSKEKKHLKLI
ncbi:MAG: LmeA family phospholipid-binding protein [Armatimonadetes bacterium]|nr:LmeA family phospholipid-binding protein [Armatimonadota bacterium]